MRYVHAFWVAGSRRSFVRSLACPTDRPSSLPGDFSRGDGERELVPREGVFTSSGKGKARHVQKDDIHAELLL